VLGRRAKASAFAFAANLAVRAEPVAEEDVARHFVAPGYDVAQAAQARCA
jgi:hypothetical protein